MTKADNLKVEERLLELGREARLVGKRQGEKECGKIAHIVTLNSFIVYHSE
jgi:hypothetical protein